MLGVTRDARRRPPASPKLAQRAVAGDGPRSIEWTYDPLQALNAHLNSSKLGVVVEEYENIYGVSSSPCTADRRPIASW
jgi:predicted GNAT superfamily acetyltransferase